VTPKGKIMAKKRRRTRNSAQPTGRNSPKITNRRLPLVVSRRSRRLTPLLGTDRRVRRPDGTRNRHLTYSLPSTWRIIERLQPREPYHRKKSTRRGNAGVAFGSPQKIGVCVRRGIRKEIIHALGYAGAGKPKQRRPRRNEFSKIGC